MDDFEQKDSIKNEAKEVAGTKEWNKLLWSNKKYKNKKISILVTIYYGIQKSLRNTLINLKVDGLDYIELSIHC